MFKCAKYYDYNKLFIRYLVQRIQRCIYHIATVATKWDSL